MFDICDILQESLSGEISLTASDFKIYSLTYCACFLLPAPDNRGQIPVHKCMRTLKQLIISHRRMA